MIKVVIGNKTLPKRVRKINPTWEGLKTLYRQKGKTEVSILRIHANTAKIWDTSLVTVRNKPIESKRA